MLQSNERSDNLELEVAQQRAQRYMEGFRQEIAGQARNDSKEAQR